MANSIDDIARQARQGSVAAIIQILNEKLAHCGVRTRAVLDNGVLQLLCEAHKAEQLEQSTLVERIRQILESLAPRNIRRVKINSRLVREQQLLWLEDINRNPEKHLLWFQEITLAKPNIIQRLAEDIQNLSAKPDEAPLPLSASSTSSLNLAREQRQFWRGIMVGGAGLGLLLLVLGLAVSNTLGLKLGSPIEAPKPAPVAEPSPKPDQFADAVRLAQQASTAGKTAKSRADWLAIAAKWQQAADLMVAVPPSHPRHKMAQDRQKLYRQNSQKAQQQAEKKGL
ncbi:hypothetical protein [Kamptonema formosum]|uniref:hypothetical protein n=1 Tax=Kamptonema formosum TaxID=331992 RepID=UPI00034A111C|nr:hypothetical protein [Oscillatoria sp. PCC 10802]